MPLIQWPVPVEPALTQDVLVCGRYQYEDPFGHVRFVIDTTAFDFHVDAHQDALAMLLGRVLTQLRALGFAPMDDDECPPELLDDGWVRVYLVPIIPMDDTPLLPVREVGLA